MDVLPLWVKGTLLCLFGSTITALGLVVQKKSHSAGDILAEDGQPVTGRYWARPWWLLGFSLFLTAQIINMVSMALTPQTVLSCLGSWTLVCNTIFARLILKEWMNNAQVLAICGLVLAMVFVICTAPRPPHDDSMTTSVAYVMSRFCCWEFHLLSAIMFGSACATWALAMNKQPKCPAFHDFICSSDDEPVVPSALSLPLTPSRAAEAAAAASDAAQQAADYVRKTLAPLSRAMAAAIASGYTALLFKCLAELIASAGVDTVNPWQCWQTYVIAAVALSCAPAELHFLNLALQLGEAIFVVPVYLALGMTSQLLTGLIFFEEYNNFTSWHHAVEFACSVAVTLLFVVAMAKAQADPLDEEFVLPGSWTEPLLQVDDTSPMPPLADVSPIAAGTKSLSFDEFGEEVLVSLEPLKLTMAGFGGAIECLDALNRGRSGMIGEVTGNTPRTKSASPRRSRVHSQSEPVIRSRSFSPKQRRPVL